MSKVLKVIFYFILVIFPFGQLLRFQIFSFPEIKFQVFDFSIFAFVAVWMINKLIKKEKFIFPDFFKEMTIFAGIAVFSFVVKAPGISFRNLLPSFFYLFRLLVYLLSFWSFYDFIKKNSLSIGKFLIFEGVITAVFALLQYLLLPDTRFIYNMGWDEHFNRAIGAFLDPSFTSLILVLALIIWLSGSLNIGKKKIQWWLSGLILVLGIAFSFSRSSYLIMFISSLIILLIKKKIKIFFSLLCGFILLIFALPKPAGEGVNLLRTNSITGKYTNYLVSLAIIKENLLFGVGFNNYRLAQKSFGFLSEENWRNSNAGAGADNSFLFVLATTGIFGLISFLFLWGKIKMRSYRLIFKSDTALILFTSLVSVCLASLFVNALFYSWVVFWLLLLLANFTAEN